jgi:uncharacterized protein (TIGR00255 family)
MSVSSMTGFGQSELSGPDYRITFEVKTFNSRFLDINVRLPRELPSLEMPVRVAAKERMIRGRVEISIGFQATHQIPCQVNRERVAGYRELFDSLQADFQIEGGLTLAVLLQLPGVLDTSKGLSPEDPAALQERVLASVREALAAAAHMRLDEGRYLARELSERTAGCMRLLEEMESFVEPAREAYRERLLQRLREFTDSPPLDADRINQEVVLFADRGDITEEVLRLRSHARQFLQLLGQGGEVGKKLDFLLQ